MLLWWPFLAVSLTITGIGYNPEIEDTPMIQILMQEDAFNLDIEAGTYAFNLGNNIY